MSTSSDDLSSQFSVPIYVALCFSPVVLFYILPLVDWFSDFIAWTPLEPLTSKAKHPYLTDALGLLKAGLAKSDIFRIVTDNGYKTVLAPKYAAEVSKVAKLSFSPIMARDFHSDIEGFEPFREFAFDGANIFQTAVRMKLTQALGGLTKHLSNEASAAIEESWTDNPKWHELTLKPNITRMVSKLSSSVFVGYPICRDTNWLRISVDYTLDSFEAAHYLRNFPAIIRPIVAQFAGPCKKIQRHIQEARSIIEPVLIERRKAKAASERDGQPSPQYNDAMEWMEHVAKGRCYDPAAAQLTFSFAAIHTTTDMMTQAMYDLAGRATLIQELRDEVIQVIPSEGWNKTAISKLHLMDSFMKESMRLKPINIVAMNRYAEENIQLNDGTIIPKGTVTMIPDYWMWDKQFYKEPESFDPYRFFKTRQIPGRENSALSTSTAPEYLVWGLGRHACPGRFFATNEVKIALCHILLKYDFKISGQTIPKPFVRETSLLANPSVNIMVRRRQEEINLDDISI